jgi:hypothetical protein
MKTPLFSLVAGAAMLTLAGTAGAGEPVQLSNAEMDGVTAGGFAQAVGQAATVGDLLSETVALTATNVNGNVFATAQAQAAGLAASVLFGAASAARSTAAATLP